VRWLCRVWKTARVQRSAILRALRRHRGGNHCTWKGSDRAEEYLLTDLDDSLQTPCTPIYSNLEAEFEEYHRYFLIVSYFAMRSGSRSSNLQQSRYHRYLWDSVRSPKLIRHIQSPTDLIPQESIPAGPASRLRTPSLLISSSRTRGEIPQRHDRLAGLRGAWSSPTICTSRNYHSLF
jgi:hypothetical protein